MAGLNNKYVYLVGKLGKKVLLQLIPETRLMSCLAHN